MYENKDFFEVGNRVIYDNGVDIVKGVVLTISKARAYIPEYVCIKFDSGRIISMASYNLKKEE